MKRLFWIAFVLAVLAVLGSPAFAEQGYQNFCQKGGVTVVTQGLNSATKVQGSSPQCLVTVYVTGTLTKATLHSNNSGTVLPNPFNAQTDGEFLLYSADGRYDITICAKGSPNPLVCGTDAVLPAPFTFTDVQLCDPATCGGGGGGTTPHNLLSTTHPDTQPYTPPVEGDLIQGNGGTSKWTRLPGNTTITPQWFRSLGNGTGVSAQGWVTRGNPCDTGKFANALTNDLVLNCDTPTLGNGLILPPPFAVPAGQSVAWAFPTTVTQSSFDAPPQSNGYAVGGIPNGIVNMTASSGLGNWGWYVKWSDFVMPTLPNDAVIQGVYGVYFAGNSGTLFAAANMGAGPSGSICPSCVSPGGNSANNPGGTIAWQGEYYTASLGATSGSVTGAASYVRLFQTLAGSFNQTLTVNATAIAIYYTSATPSSQVGYYFPIPGTSGGGSGTVSTLSVGNLNPLFNASVANPTTTPAITFSRQTAGAHLFYGNNTGSSAVPDMVAIGIADLPIQPQGTTAKYATVSGALATGNCTIADALQNLVDGGTCGLLPGGTWDSGTNYAKNTVVLYNGSSYYSLLANLGVTPGSDPATWGLLAAAGLNGSSGTNGTNGAPGAPGYSPNQILSGCGVIWNSLLNFNIAPCSYLIQNTQYSTAATSISLAAADPSLDRIDVIAVNSSSVVTVITGTPSASPTPPSVDISTQLQLTFVYVAAGATVPSNVVTTDIYHENTEWTCATSGAAVVCNSTNNPHSGTKDVEWTNAATGAFERHTIPSSTTDLNNFNAFSFWIRSKATWPATRSLTIQWYNGTTAKCSPVSLKDGNFTFNSSNTTSYQQIVIPTSTFACGGIPVTRVQITEAGSGGNLGFYVDDIILQGGVTSSVSSSGLNPRGAWSASLAYSVNDLVNSNGGSWYALVANTNSTPSVSNANWQSMGAVAPFISGTVNPATTGVVRLGINDKVAWRNDSNTSDCTFGLITGNIWSFDACGAVATEFDFLTELAAAASTPAAGHSTVFVDTTSGFPCGKDSSGVAHCAGGGTVTPSGTLTNHAIILGQGTSVVAALGSLGTSTTVLHGAAAGDPSFSAIATGDIAANAVTSAKEAVVNTRRTCSLQVGDGTNTVVTADYSPFKVASCKVPYAATIVEIDIQTDAGTPSILLERRRGAATLADLLSGALAAAGTTPVCSTTVISQTCIDGTTSSGSITLSNTGLNAGDVIEVKSGTGSTETSARISVVFTVN
jgi:hypothetical protein